MRWRLPVFVILTVTLVGTAAALRLGARETACCATPSSPSPAWVARLRALDAAITAGDVARAARAWPDAWGGALGSRRWEALLAAGDLALRAGELDGAKSRAQSRAREAYQAALFRAHGERSVQGVLRAAEAMIAMGDRDMPEGALRMARRLAAATGDAAALNEVELASRRLAEGSASHTQASR
jgi:hypothetical protein